MKKFVPTVSAMALVGSLAASVFAAGGVLVRQEATSDYCHMKFPAIQARTLATNHPQLKSSSTGDVIDYYGACDESPTGRDQVTAQRQEEQFRFGRDYEDGD